MIFGYHHNQQKNPSKNLYPPPHGQVWMCIAIEILEIIYFVITWTFICQLTNKKSSYGIWTFTLECLASHRKWSVTAPFSLHWLIPRVVHFSPCKNVIPGLKLRKIQIVYIGRLSSVDQCRQSEFSSYSHESRTWKSQCKRTFKHFWRISIKFIPSQGRRY